MRSTLSVALLLAGCAHPEVTLLVGSKYVGFRGQEDTSPAISLSIAQRFGKRGICLYSHDSQPFEGEPFNGDAETTHDFAGCGFTWRGER